MRGERPLQLHHPQRVSERRCSQPHEAGLGWAACCDSRPPRCALLEPPADPPRLAALQWLLSPCRPRAPTDLFIGYTVVNGTTRLYADFTPPANNGGERELAVRAWGSSCKRAWGARLLCLCAHPPRLAARRLTLPAFSPPFLDARV